MKYLVDAATMKAVDNYSIERVGIPSVVLMERAALKVTEYIISRIDRPEAVKVLCVCGSGNNGADGLCVARQLSERGIRTHISLVSEGEGTKEYALQKSICSNLGIDMINNPNYSEYDYIVDAIFGIGLSRCIEGNYARVIEDINKAKQDNGVVVIAVDIASGVNASDGSIMGCAIKADNTVTFGYNKIGIMLYPGADYCGNVIIADIGFAPVNSDLIENFGDVITYDSEDILTLPKRKADSNKGTYGKALIVAGSKTIGGAAILSAKAAFSCGTGLVKVFTHKENRDAILSTIPEGLIETYNDSDEAGILVDKLASSLSWASCVVVGPGLSMEDEAGIITRQLCEYTDITRIFDADALNIIARDNLRIDSDMEHSTFVTPHLAEMARLTGCSVKDIKKDLVGTAKRYAKDNNCICILKDARTVVSDGDRVYINSSGNDGMATAGSGDVLTGVLVGLCAIGLSGFEAASMAVYVHGLAGDKAAALKGKRVMTATDIIKGLEEIFKII